MRVFVLFLLITLILLAVYGSSEDLGSKCCQPSAPSSPNTEAVIVNIGNIGQPRMSFGVKIWTTIVGIVFLAVLIYSLIRLITHHGGWYSI